MLNSCLQYCEENLEEVMISTFRAEFKLYRIIKQFKQKKNDLVLIILTYVKIEVKFHEN